MVVLLTLVFAVIVFELGLVCNGSDTLLPGQSLLPNQTLISKGAKFELGFFSPGNSTNYYLGIWYKSIPLQTVVWMLNRDSPIPYSSYNNSQLQFLPDDNSVLCLLSAEILMRCIGDNSHIISEAVILDTGNFVLRDASGGILWQSFDYPTDTWLPDMGRFFLGYLYPLHPWTNPNDPASGKYSVYIADSRSISVELEKSGGWQRGICSNLSSFSKSHILALHSTDVGVYDMHDFYNESLLLSRVVIESRGELTGFGWSEATQAWIVVASTAHSMCWSNTICDANHSPACRCLDGFEPRVQQEWDLSDFSNGCRRKMIPLQCDESKIRFIKVTVARLPANRKHWTASNDLCNVACSRSCSCSAYAYDSDGSCLWYIGDLLALQSPQNTSVGVDIYIKTESTHTRKVLVVALVVSIAAAVILSCFCFCYIWPKLKRKVSGERNQNLLLIDLNSSEKTNAEGKESGHELPVFSLSSIAASTNNFSITNKLGQGGFGPVFKGELLNGQFVAVKRLSKSSGQGLEEFRNEMEIIAKLQHRNLVRILGCCNEKDEMILVYEYMPNKSLDSLLFDSNKKEILDWKKRVHIISGIAQGLLYLHQYSRLRLVHRDLKASNILLDADMNPKISDFGMARIFGGNDSQANTKRIVGTYGYMSPEYAMEGLFSVKSDVFAFGILMLEIISGKKNTGLYGSEYRSLLRYAWDLWKSDCVDELIDPILELSNGSSSTAIRYIQISLLCVEENPVDRPLISDIVGMLNNEKRSIESPRNPALTIGRALVKKNPTQHEVKRCSINDMSVSYVEAR